MIKDGEDHERFRSLDSSGKLVVDKCNESCEISCRLRNCARSTAPEALFLWAHTMIDVASWEFNIPVDFVDDGGNVHDAIITNLYDSDGEQTWRPEAAMVAVGVMISGPRAGEWIVIDDITSDELKPYVH